ncbi:histone-like nucleoid-structuring protein Lsr2 [Streptomyces sp. NPDC020379]|uniref:Lsr2 family DNA-binding protein n=1 Tax=Streptomyces sp. NPDC020379 TaxID=3365071 RepID=UPI0037A01603
MAVAYSVFCPATERYSLVTLDGRWIIPGKEGYKSRGPVKTYARKNIADVRPDGLVILEPVRHNGPFQATQFGRRKGTCRGALGMSMRAMVGFDCTCGATVDVSHVARIGWAIVRDGRGSHTVSYALDASHAREFGAVSMEVPETANVVVKTPAQESEPVTEQPEQREEETDRETEFEPAPEPAPESAEAGASAALLAGTPRNAGVIFYEAADAGWDVRAERQAADFKANRGRAARLFSEEGDGRKRWVSEDGRTVIALALPEDAVSDVDKRFADVLAGAIAAKDAGRVLKPSDVPTKVKHGRGPGDAFKRAVVRSAQPLVKPWSAPKIPAEGRPLSGDALAALDADGVCAEVEVAPGVWLPRAAVYVAETAAANGWTVAMERHRSGTVIVRMAGLSPRKPVGVEVDAVWTNGMFDQTRSVGYKSGARLDSVVPLSVVLTTIGQSANPGTIVTASAPEEFRPDSGEAQENESSAAPEQTPVEDCNGFFLDHDGEHGEPGRVYDCARPKTHAGECSPVWGDRSTIPAPVVSEPQDQEQPEETTPEEMSEDRSNPFALPSFVRAVRLDLYGHRWGVECDRHGGTAYLVPGEYRDREDAEGHALLHAYDHPVVRKPLMEEEIEAATQLAFSDAQLDVLSYADQGWLTEDATGFYVPEQRESWKPKKFAVNRVLTLWAAGFLDARSVDEGHRRSLALSDKGKAAWELWDRARRLDLVEPAEKDNAFGVTAAQRRAYPLLKNVKPEERPEEAADDRPEAPQGATEKRVGELEPLCTVRLPNGVLGRVMDVDGQMAQVLVSSAMPRDAIEFSVADLERVDEIPRLYVPYDTVIADGAAHTVSKRLGPDRVLVFARDGNGEQRTFATEDVTLLADMPPVECERMADGWWRVTYDGQVFLSANLPDSLVRGRLATLCNLTVDESGEMVGRGFGCPSNGPSIYWYAAHPGVPAPNVAWWLDLQGEGTPLPPMTEEERAYMAAGPQAERTTPMQSVRSGEKPVAKGKAPKVGDIHFTGAKGDEKAVLLDQCYEVEELAGEYLVHHIGSGDEVCHYVKGRPAMKRAILADAVARGQESERGSAVVAVVAPKPNPASPSAGLDTTVQQPSSEYGWERPGQRFAIGDVVRSGHPRAHLDECTSRTGVVVSVREHGGEQIVGVRWDGQTSVSYEQDSSTLVHVPTVVMERGQETQAPEPTPEPGTDIVDAEILDEDDEGPQVCEDCEESPCACDDPYAPEPEPKGLELDGQELTEWLDSLTGEQRQEIAGKLPVRWLYPWQEGQPERCINVCGGCGGGCVGYRQILGVDLDMICIDTSKDACATAEAAGCTVIQMDIRELDPCHPALRWTRRAAFTMPCPDWTMAGKGAGRAPENVEILCNAIADVAEAYGNVWVTGGAYGDASTAVYRDVADFPVEEMWSWIDDMTAKTAGLMLAPVLIGMGLIAAGAPLETILIEQSHSLPESVRGAIGIEYIVAGWDGVRWDVLNAGEFGAPSNRRRAVMMGHRDNVLEAVEAPGIVTMASDAIGWAPETRINTRGVRKTQGGNAFVMGRTIPGVTSKIRGWYDEATGRRFTIPEVCKLVGLPDNHPVTGSRTSQCQQLGDIFSPLVSAAVWGTLLGVPWLEMLRNYLALHYPNVHGAEDKDAPITAPAGGPQSEPADENERRGTEPRKPVEGGAEKSTAEGTGEDAAGKALPYHREGCDGRTKWLYVAAEGVARMLRHYLACDCGGTKLGNFQLNAPAMSTGTQRNPLGIDDVDTRSADALADRESYDRVGRFVVLDEVTKRAPVEWRHDRKPIPVVIDPNSAAQQRTLGGAAGVVAPADRAENGVEGPAGWRGQDWTPANGDADQGAEPAPDDMTGPVVVFIASKNTAPPRLRVLWRVTRAEAVRICSDDRSGGRKHMLCWTADPGEQGRDWEFVRDSGSYNALLSELGITPARTWEQPESVPDVVSESNPDPLCGEDGEPCNHAIKCDAEGQGLEKSAANENEQQAASNLKHEHTQEQGRRDMTHQTTQSAPDAAARMLERLAEQIKHPNIVPFVSPSSTPDLSNEVTPSVIEEPADPVWCAAHQVPTEKRPAMEVEATEQLTLAGRVWALCAEHAAQFGGLLVDLMGDPPAGSTPADEHEHEHQEPDATEAAAADNKESGQPQENPSPQAGWNPQIFRPVDTGDDDADGPSVMLTGEVPGYSWDDARQALRNAGYRVVGRADESTVLLILGKGGERNTTKLQDAAERRIPCMDVRDPGRFTAAVCAGEFVGGDPLPTPIKQDRRRPSDRERTQKIRAWAKQQGYPVSDRGRLPDPVRVAWTLAHQSEGIAA